MRFLRDNALNDDNQSIDPPPRLTRISGPTYGSVARPAQLSTSCRLRQYLPLVLTAVAFFVSQQVHANNIEAGQPNEKEPGSNPSGYSKPLYTNTSPFLQLVSSLSCSVNSEEASSALSPLESNLIESWQLPNEWIGLDRPPELYAGSLDIAIANLIATAEKYPELQNRIDALLLSWNYCHVIGIDTFYDLPEQSDTNSAGSARTISPLKRPAGKSPFEWSGFQRLGIHPTAHSLVDDITSSDNRYIPGLSLQTQKTPRYREESLWREHTQQCLPHPTTGRMYFIPRPSGPTRIDLSFLNQMIAEPYPFNLNKSCGINENPDTKTPAQDPVDAKYTKVPEEPENATLAAAPVGTQAPAKAASHENTEQEENAEAVIQAAIDESNAEPQATGELPPQLELADQEKSVIEFTKKIPPSNAEAQKIGKHKRLSKFKTRLVHASRNSSEENESKGNDTAETRLQAIKAAIADKSLSQEQPATPQQDNPAIAAALPEPPLDKLDADADVPYYANTHITLDSYRKSLVASEKLEDFLLVERAKRLSPIKAARVRLSRGAIQNQLAGAGHIPDTPLSPPTVQSGLAEQIHDSHTARIINENAIKKEKSKRLHGLKVARVLLSRAVAAAEKQRIADNVARKNTQSATGTTNSDNTLVVVLSPHGNKNGIQSENKNRKPRESKVSRETVETRSDTFSPRLPGTHTPPHVLVLSARPVLKKYSLSRDRPKVLVLSANGINTVTDTDEAVLASNRQTEIEYKRQQSKRLQAARRQRVRLSRANKVQVIVNPKETEASSVLARREKSKRLHAVKIWRVILSRQFKHRQNENLLTDAPGIRQFPGRRTVSFSPADSSRLAFRQMLKIARSNSDHQQDNSTSYAYAYRGGRRYMTTANIWRVLLSREFAARARVPGWKSAYSYNLPSSNSPAAIASRRRHGLRIWGEQWFGFRNGHTNVNSYASAAATTAAPSTPDRSSATNYTEPDTLTAAPDNSIQIPGIDNGQAIQLIEESTETLEIGAAVQSIASAGATPGNNISPVSNAPPFRAPNNGTDTSHGFSGSFTLNNTELEFGDTDHYSVTSQIAYKPVKDSYFFARTGVTINNSDEPLTYTWGVGYDDWHPGTWGFEINNWNPLQPGDGLDLDNAIVSLSRKFGWKKLADHNLASSLSLNKSVNSDFALTWLISYAPIENWFVRTLLTQSLEGEGLSWAYGFGYNNWRKNTIAIEYNNWGFNEAFDTNFKDNAVVTISYKWEW